MTDYENYSENPEEYYEDKDPSVYLDGFQVIDEQDEFDAIELFRYAVTQNCSDIHLKAGSPPKLRINGELKPIEGIRKLTSQDTDLIRQQTMSDADHGEYINRKYDHVYAYDIPSVGRFRMIVTLSLGTQTLTARKLVDTPPSFDDLGTNPAIRDLVNFSSGLILVSGITGSGKSTLMAAMINEINQNNGYNIISIEDPVEIIHRDIRSNIIQRNIGTDVVTFSNGVRDAMRQDPDVILIGEIRDPETAQAALKAAETGHLVISTVHAMNSVSSIARMLDLFEGHQDLKAVRNRFSDVLRGIVTQKLVKSTASNGQLIAVNEILLNTAEMKEALENDASPTELRKLVETGGEYGMQTFEQHFLELVQKGLVTEKVALAQAVDPEQMKELLKGLKKETPTPAANTSPVKSSAGFVFPAQTPKKSITPFSEAIKKEEAEKGVVVNRSGAAPELPKAPVRPNIYVPPTR